MIKLDRYLKGLGYLLASAFALLSQATVAEEGSDVIEEVVVTGSALNLTDERAPLAPHEQGYDAYTHNPLGRVFQVGLRYTLGNG